MKSMNKKANQGSVPKAIHQWYMYVSMKAWKEALPEKKEEPKWPMFVREKSSKSGGKKVRSQEGKKRGKEGKGKKRELENV